MTQQNNDVEIVKSTLQSALNTDFSVYLDDPNVPPYFKALLGMFRSVVQSLQVLVNNNKLTPPQNDDDSSHEIERQRSLVLIGLPESDKVKASDRVADDEKTIPRHGPLCTGWAVITQLGGRGRPVKVVLPSKKFQWMALRAWRRCRDEMRNQNCWRSLIVRPSLPPDVLEKERLERPGLNAWAAQT